MKQRFSAGTAHGRLINAPLSRNIRYSKPKYPSKERGSPRLYWCPYLIIIIMNLDIPMPHINQKLISRPALPRIRPSRKVAQEAPPCTVKLTKGSEALAEPVGEAHRTMAVCDDYGPVEGARQVQAYVAVDRVCVQNECTSIRRAVDLSSDTSVRRLHTHLHALVPVTLRYIGNFIETLQKRDVGVYVPMC
jgi:hypothetical protein